MIFRKNVGSYDRMMRIIGGSTLAAFGLLKSKTCTGKLVGMLGAAWAMEGIVGYCFYYDLIGLSTSDKE